MPELSSPQQRFAALQLTLPSAPRPVEVYKPALVVGQQLYASGRGPLLPDDIPVEIEAVFELAATH